MISVITVEYDIREDQPEGTEVFVLETSSLELIGKLVASRFSDLSQLDVQTVANASGGNARVALAIAGTIEKNETVAGLRDADLIHRLFQQRHDPDPSLMRIAQACSLVYSFEGETLTSTAISKFESYAWSFLGEIIGRRPMIENPESSNPCRWLLDSGASLRRPGMTKWMFGAI